MADETVPGETEDTSADSEDVAGDQPENDTEGAEESGSTPDEKQPDTGKARPPGKEGEQPLEARYKELQAEFTRRSQRLAEMERERERERTDSEALRRKAQALDALSQNPEFREWAEQRVLRDKLGEDFDPDQVKLVDAVLERRLAAEREKIRKELEEKYEPARRSAAEAKAEKAIAAVAGKWGDLWDAKADLVAQTIEQLDIAAEKNPEVRRLMDDPDEKFVEGIFLRLLSPEEIREHGRKAHLAELEKKKKANVAASGTTASGVLADTPAATIAEALAQAKRAHNVQAIPDSD
jgi:hypothetical protein